MHITDDAVEALVNTSDYKDPRATEKQIIYGNMRFKQGGIDAYSMTVIFRNRGNGWWNVYGRSGDFGWGSAYITQRHTYGKRVRMQIYNKLIKKMGVLATEVT